MENKPFVSVFLSTYNSASYVAKALESILKQSYRNFELVVIDDCSTDNTKEILDRFCKEDARMKLVLHSKNLGSAKTLNEGVERARGKYIARLDDDDFWRDPKKLEKQVEFLEAHPAYCLVGGGIIKVTQNGKEIGRYLFPERDEDIRKTILIDNAFAHSTVVYRRDAWKQAGGYKEQFGFFADRALWLKMGTIGKFYNFQEYFTVYLEKEQSGNYERRNVSIRRKIGDTIKLAHMYRNEYPGFWRAFLLAWANYLYSFMPMRYKLRPVLYRIRTLFLGSPGYTYSKHKKNEK